MMDNFCITCIDVGNEALILGGGDSRRTVCKYSRSNYKSCSELRFTLQWSNCPWSSETSKTWNWPYHISILSSKFHSVFLFQMKQALQALQASIALQASPESPALQASPIWRFEGSGSTWEDGAKLHKGYKHHDSFTHPSFNNRPQFQMMFFNYCIALKQINHFTPKEPVVRSRSGRSKWSWNLASSFRAMFHNMSTTKERTSTCGTWGIAESPMRWYRLKWRNARYGRSEASRPVRRRKGSGTSSG